MTRSLPVVVLDSSCGSYIAVHYMRDRPHGRSTVVKYACVYVAQRSSRSSSALGRVQPTVVVAPCRIRPDPNAVQCGRGWV